MRTPIDFANGDCARCEQGWEIDKNRGDCGVFAAPEGGPERALRVKTDQARNGAGVVGPMVLCEGPGVDGLVVQRTRELAEEFGVLGTAYIDGEKAALGWAVRLAPETERCCLECSDGVPIVDRAIEYDCRRLQVWNPRFCRADVEKAMPTRLPATCSLAIGQTRLRRRRRSLRRGSMRSNWANKVLPVARRLAAR